MMILPGIKSTTLMLILFCLSLTIRYSNSSLIFESRPKSIIQEGFKNELKKIQEYKSMSKLDLGNYTYADETLGTVEISQLKQEIQYYELNKLNLTLQDNLHQILTGKDGTLKLQYSFVYNTSSEIQDKGSFNLESSKYTVTKTFNITSDNILQHNGTITSLEFLPNNIIYEGDMSLKNLIEAAINSLPTWITPKLLAAYQQDFYDYYSTNTGANRTVISFQTKTPELDCSLDLTWDKLPYKLNENSILYYLSGKLNDHEEINKEPLFDQEPVYQVFLDRGIFYNLLSDMTKEGLLDFTLTKENKPQRSPFNLNIQSLGQIIPEVYDLYARDEEIKVYTKVSSIDLSQSNKLGGYFSMRTTIYMLNDMSDIFEYETKYSFNLNYTLASDKMNFYVDNTGLNIVDLKILNSNYKKVDKNTLIKWTDMTLQAASSQNFFLLKSPLDLSSYFSQIAEVKCNQNGCLLKGAAKVLSNLNDKAIHYELEFLN